jgi:hypothetical protein
MARERRLGETSAMSADDTSHETAMKALELLR